ncbi:hypothetical protein [Streptomyces antibioticus]|uniref:hypothetical protein n=1 Tax=Streptomyces antibioticus TaxID=1890 RepID=UPI001FD73FC1|nr:hypothetical protein [Streptomyces antibioticus]
MTAALACLVLVGAAVVAGDSAAEERSAAEVLDEANERMRALTSVTIDGVTDVAGGGGYSIHVTTDLTGRCTSKVTWDTGAGLEQIRIGDSDYVRPNRALVEQSGQDVAGTQEQRFWAKTPAAEAQREEGLIDCTHDFTSFGTVTKGKPAEVDGEWAIVLKVTEADDEGSFTFYVAAEGEPYIRKVVYEGPEYHSTTEFSAFDEPLNVRPPAEADVLDMSVLGR